MQALQPLTTLFQFVCELLLFDADFNLAQYIALGFLFSLYIAQGIKFLVYDLPREKKRDELKRKEVEKLGEEILNLKNSIAEVKMEENTEHELVYEHANHNNSREVTEHEEGKAQL